MLRKIRIGTATLRRNPLRILLVGIFFPRQSSYEASTKSLADPYLTDLSRSRIIHGWCPYSPCLNGFALQNRNVFITICFLSLERVMLKWTNSTR
jgi:hypothetical protein